MDTFLTVVQVVIGLVFVGIGIEMTVHPPTTSRSIWVYRGSFALLGVLTIAITIWQSNRAARQEEARDIRQANATDSLKAQLQSSQVQSAGDLGYLRGQLETLLQRDANPKQIAEAFLAGSAELIKAQVKKQSDEDLSSSAIELAKEMRAFETKRKSRELSDLLSERYDPSITEQQRTEQFYRRTNALTQRHAETVEEFRSKYLGRALYLRDELLKRLGEKAPVVDRRILIAFDGFLAGPSPISDAGDYLERLARYLAPTQQ